MRPATTDILTIPAPAPVYHTPVLLVESVDALNVRRGGVYVDATFGGGGHTREILRRIKASGGGRLFGFDQDGDAAANIPASDDFTFVRSNFRWLKNWMRYYGVSEIDGLLADFGVSGHHFDDPARGFSLRFDGPLDMRMNRAAHRTAADILREASEERLSDIFYYNGELRQARRLASLIVRARQRRDIVTTADLLGVVSPLIPPARAKKEQAKIFQALRIEVNGELGALRDLLRAAVDLLRPGGRLAVITYHSLEDRIVKGAMKPVATDGEPDLYGASRAVMKVVGKSVSASAAEQRRNPRSRSARLRVAEKI